MQTSRKWRTFLFYTGPFVVAAGLVVLFLPEYRNLALLFLFTIVSNSVVPMPYEPIMVVMGALFTPLLAGAVAGLQAVAAPRPSDPVRSACPPAPPAPLCAVAPACTVALALDLPRWWRGDVGLFLSGVVVALVASQLGRREPNRSAGVLRLRSYGG